MLLRRMAFGSFEDAGAGLRMQAFELAVEGLHRVEQVMIEVGVDRVADHRVAEHAGGDGREIPVALVAHAMWRLVEEEELVFGFSDS